MRDQETGSLWSQLLGRCMRGELEGTELRFLPAAMTTWRAWREKYPDTTVLNLSRSGIDYDQRRYRNPDAFVIGIKVGPALKAYPFPVLSEHPIYQDEVGGSAVLIAFDPESTRALAFERKINGHLFSFRSKTERGLLVEQTTGATFDPWSGECLEGEFAGQNLPVLFAIVSYRATWIHFHPDSLIAK